MQKNKSRTILALTVAICATAWASNVKAAETTGAISGRVIQQGTEGGIEGTPVWAELLACPSHICSDTTDGNGDYLIEGLPPGNYKVYTRNNLDFADLYWNNRVDPDEADTVEVITNDTTESIDFSLRVGGKITGTVTFTGATYLLASITAVNVATGSLYYGLATNPLGDSASYEVKRLPTGTYKVRTENALGRVDEYYDNKSSWASADPVSVTEGVTTSSVDLALGLGGTINGNVSSGAKVPLENIPVWGYYATNPEWRSSTVTDGFGEYTLEGLRTGYWKIYAHGDVTHSLEWFSNEDDWCMADSILVVAPNPLTGVDFPLETGGSISGYVYGLTGGPLFGAEVSSFESSFFGIGPLVKMDTTSMDGSYSISGLRTGYYYVISTNECDSIWYDDKLTWEEADLVYVAMPSETPGVNFNMPSAVEEPDHVDIVPRRFHLQQNYPNPFNPRTEIEYTIQRPAQVTLDIFNILGRKVKTLIRGHQPSGSYHLTWDGRNEEGKTVSCGVYLYRLQVDGDSEAKRMLLLK